MQFLLTLIIGAAVGFLFLKGKIPGGMMVGALVGAVLFNVTTDMAYMPSTARMAAQITAGAFIGATVKKSDVRRMPHLAKPALILLSGMFVLNMVMGTVTHFVSGLDWLTAFFCAVPGGMSDVPIIAADMGGKIKTVLQAVVIILYLLPFTHTIDWLHTLAWILMLVTVAVTVVTGVDYVVRAWRLARRPDRG